jgi:hypothetical protein
MAASHLGPAPNFIVQIAPQKSCSKMDGKLSKQDIMAQIKQVLTNNRIARTENSCIIRSWSHALKLFRSLLFLFDVNKFSVTVFLVCSFRNTTYN